MKEIYEKLNLLAKSARGAKNVVICPFSMNGWLLKQILNQVYDIKETCIIDNGLSLYNPKILSISSLNTLNLSGGIVVLLNTTNEQANKELVKELEALHNDHIIIKNVLEPVVAEVPEKKEYFSELKEVLKIRKCVEYDLIRVGRQMDGGYIMLDDFSADMKSYSFGICDEISWDDYIASQGIINHMYDHTIDKLPYEHSNFIFHKIGIAGVDIADKKLYSMKTILENNGDIKNKNLILKMDVEGAEWDFIEQCPDEILDNFLQITFELHGLTQVIYKEKYINILKKLNKTHQVVWLHGNVYSFAESSDGIVVPDCLEITYANKRKYHFIDSVCDLPLDIDFPNDGKMDFIMGNWGDDREKL